LAGACSQARRSRLATACTCYSAGTRCPAGACIAARPGGLFSRRAAATSEGQDQQRKHTQSTTDDVPHDHLPDSRTPRKGGNGRAKQFCSFFGSHPRGAAHVLRPARYPRQKSAGRSPLSSASYRHARADCAADVPSA
jgi:hypothetical protein